MSGRERIARAAGVVGGATLLSRIFGFLRDMIVAQLFGAGMSTDAFFVAFRIPNLLRRLVGEGSLTVSFIPVYTEYLNRRSKEESDGLVHASLCKGFQHAPPTDHARRARRRRDDHCPKIGGQFEQWT